MGDNFPKLCGVLTVVCSIQDVISDLLRLYLIKRERGKGEPSRLRIPKALRQRILNGLSKRGDEGQRTFDRTIDLIWESIPRNDEGEPLWGTTTMDLILSQFTGLQESFEAFDPPMRGRMVFAELLVTTGEHLSKESQGQRAGPMIRLAKSVCNHKQIHDASLHRRIETLSALISEQCISSRSEDLQSASPKGKSPALRASSSLDEMQECRISEGDAFAEMAVRAYQRWRQKKDEEVVDEWLQDQSTEGMEVKVPCRDSSPTREMIFA